MPCTDVTDYLELKLDSKDRIQSFDLKKLTCGRTVGGSLLLPFVKGKSSDRVLIGSIEEFVGNLKEHPDEENFLFHKQLFSLQSALSALTGNPSGYQTTPFEIENVNYDKSGTFISGYIAMDQVKVEEITACGNCACSSKKSKKAPPPKLVPLSSLTKSK